MGIFGKSETREAIIELKNKSTTLNSSSLEGTLLRIEKLKLDYPTYNFIIGYINDNKHRDERLEENVWILGGDSLFQYVFGNRYLQVQSRIKEIVNSYYS